MRNNALKLISWIQEFNIYLQISVQAVDICVSSSGKKLGDVRWKLGKNIIFIIAEDDVI